MVSLTKVFGDQLSQRILLTTLKNPERDFTISELTKKLRSTKKTVQKEVARLEKSDLLTIKKPLITDKVGDTEITVCCNQQHYLYPELRALFIKEMYRAREKFKDELKHLRGVQLLLLTGAFVDLANSKIDILIVGDVSRESLAKLLKKFSGTAKRSMQYTLFTEAEYRYRMEITDRFLYDILAQRHIVLVDHINHPA
jgi:transcriptional antiterminator